MLWVKKKKCTQPWNDKRKQNKGAKVNDLVDVKRVCHRCICTTKKRTPGKKHNPGPGQVKRGKPGSLISSKSVWYWSQIPTVTSPAEGAIWRSVTGVYHIWKKNWKKTVSLGIILWKIGDVYKCKATWTPKNKNACWKVTNVPSNSKKSKAESCRSTVRSPKCFTSENRQRKSSSTQAISGNQGLLGSGTSTVNVSICFENSASKVF